MSNCYTTWTGVLILKTMTPVIKALFSEFELGKGETTETEVYIANVAESTSPNWDNIAEELETLCTILGVEGDPSDDVKDLLADLAGHFGCADNPDFKDWLERASFTDEVEVATLFDLAQNFDDGHGLKAIKLEGAHVTSRPLLSGFGGYGQYLGKHFCPTISSHRAGHFGQTVDNAIASGQIDAAAQAFFSLIEDQIQSVVDPQVRKALRAKLAAKVASGEKEGNHFPQTLQALIEEGLDFGECKNAFSEGDENPYINAALLKAEYGDFEVDSSNVVSSGEDDGAYVLGWIWVKNHEAGVYHNSDLLEMVHDRARAGISEAQLDTDTRHLRIEQLKWLSDTIMNFAGELDSIETETPKREPRPIKWTAADNSTVEFKPSEALVALREIAVKHGGLMESVDEKVKAFCSSYGEKLDAMLTVISPEV